MQITPEQQRFITEVTNGIYERKQTSRPPQPARSGKDFWSGSTRFWNGLITPNVFYVLSNVIPRHETYKSGEGAKALEVVQDIVKRMFGRNANFTYGDQHLIDIMMRYVDVRPQFAHHATTGASSIEERTQPRLTTSQILTETVIILNHIMPRFDTYDVLNDVITQTYIELGYGASDYRKVIDAIKDTVSVEDMPVLCLAIAFIWSHKVYLLLQKSPEVFKIVLMYARYIMESKSTQNVRNIETMQQITH
jgi:hypothetical protein